MKILKLIFIASIFIISGCAGESNAENLSEAEQGYLDKLKEFFSDDAVVEYIPEESKFEVLVTNVDYVMYLKEMSSFDIYDPASEESKTYVGTLNRMMIKYSEEFGDPYTIVVLDPSNYKENVYVFKSGHQTYSRPFK